MKTFHEESPMKPVIALLSMLSLAHAAAIARSEAQVAPAADPTAERALVHLPGEPAEEAYDNSKARFLVSRPDWSLAELEEAAGYKTPLHRHAAWDESFYVLSGTLTVHVDGKTYELSPGAFLRVPRGSPHGQANFGDKPVRFLLNMQPGGFERHLKDRIALARTTPPEAPDFRARMDAIRRKNADLIEILGTWER
jgi:mannose-6-phosphate isomerase-like protein (cupin superfamily)